MGSKMENQLSMKKMKFLCCSSKVHVGFFKWKKFLKKEGLNYMPVLSIPHHTNGLYIELNFVR